MNKYLIQALFVITIFIFMFFLAESIVVKPVIHFSEGERVGVVRKLSKKGWIWKTYEGELMLNAGMGTTVLDTFNFSVPNDSIAKALLNAMGENVVLHYDQYIYVPWKVGGSNYLIKDFKTKQ